MQDATHEAFEIEEEDQIEALKTLGN